MTDQSPFNLGDLVRLKSGGPQLVVSWTAGMESAKIYLPGSIEGITAIGFDSGGTPITVSAPIVCFEPHPSRSPTDADIRSAPMLPVHPEPPAAPERNLSELFQTPKVNTDLSPETKAAAIEMVAHLMRTNEPQTLITLWDLTYENKPFGDVEIVIRKKV